MNLSTLIEVIWASQKCSVLSHLWLSSIIFFEKERKKKEKSSFFA